MPLTVIQIENAKCKEKLYKLTDGEGLTLFVEPKGGKYWRFRYRYAGQEKMISFGTYPEISLKLAREKRNRARTMVQMGQDPSVLRRTQKAIAKGKVGCSFKEVTEEWFEKRKGKWAEKTRLNIMNSLTKNVLPYAGEKPIDEFTKQDVLKILKRIEDTGATHTVRRVRQRMGDIFRYAMAIDKATTNPARDVDLTILKEPEKVKHHATLNKSELPDFLQKLRAYDGGDATRLALQFLLLTFVRTKELRMAKWHEFNFDNALWTIPADRMKMGKTHAVPLSTQALALLKEIKALSGDSEYIFPASQRRKHPYMSENTILFAIYRMGYHTRMTGHGVRSLASTVLNENGFRSDLIEKQLAHEERNEVRAAYNHAEYIEERRKMMQWWGDYLDGAVSERKEEDIKKTIHSA